MNGICELVPLARRRSPRPSGSTVPALVEVNLSGEAVEVGRRADELPRFLGLYGDVRGLMTMPPASDGPGGVAAVLPPPAASSPATHGLRELSMGTSQDYRRRSRGGAHATSRVGSVALSRQ